MFNFNWYSGYEVAAFAIYLTGATFLFYFALRGTFCCPRKLSQTVSGVLCEMAANGSNSSFMVYAVYTLVFGGLAYALHWHIFSLLIAVCSLLSFLQSKVYEFRRCRFKIAEKARKEQTQKEDLE